MLISLSFHFSVDVWSVGCIMAEMVRGSVLFPGSDRILTCLSCVIHSMVIPSLFYTQYIVPWYTRAFRTIDLAQAFKMNWCKLSKRFVKSLQEDGFRYCRPIYSFLNLLMPEETIDLFVWPGCRGKCLILCCSTASHWVWILCF